jgi:hypothetical protein
VICNSLLSAACRTAEKFTPARSASKLSHEGMVQFFFTTRISFFLMWYMIIGAGWCLYFFLWAFYKIYYYLFKGIAVGCKKLYQLIKGKTAAPSEASVEPPKE